MLPTNILVPTDLSEEATRALETGDATSAITSTAEKLGCDLIVMGTHGRTGVSRFLLGSIAEMVVRKAPCPVLTIHTHDKAEAAAA